MGNEAIDEFRKLFVSRSDVFAVATERKPGYRVIRHELENRVLEGHLAGKFSVGSYLVLPERNLARVLCLDIDADRRGAVERLAEQLAYFFPRECVVVERTGGRGWHIWLLFDSWISASKIQAFGQRVVTDANPGIKVEIYPKSTEVEAKGFGTLVRLPLGLHPRTGKPGQLLSVDFKPLKLGAIELARESKLPLLVIGDEEGPQAILSRVRKWPCIAALEKGVTEGQRDEAMFALACHYRDQGLNESVVFKAVSEANERNIPPLEERIIKEKVSSAFKDKAKIGCSTPVLKDHCKRNICWLHRTGRVEGIRRTWRAGDLLRADLPPLHWVVQDMLPQGFALLSGKPKIGKSWMALDLAISVAAGRPFLGHSTNQGPALFLALEDGEARLQERLRYFDVPEDLPLQIEFDFDRFGEGGYVDLEDLLADGFEDIPFQLVVIDCLSRAKSTKREELSPEDMEIIVRPLQAWGHAVGACFLVVHHHRKSASGDVIWDPRGSGAIVGVADVSIGIYEESGVYRFVTRSRDAPELSYYLRFSEGHWIREEREEALKSAKGLGKVAMALIEREGFVEAQGLADFGKVALRTAQSTLNKLVERGYLICDKNKRPYSYRLRVEQAEFDLEEEIEL